MVWGPGITVTNISDRDGLRFAVVWLACSALDHVGTRARIARDTSARKYTDTTE